MATNYLKTDGNLYFFIHVHHLHPSRQSLGVQRLGGKSIHRLLARLPVLLLPGNPANEH